MTTEMCWPCVGTGELDRTTPFPQECPACEGTGRIVVEEGVWPVKEKT